MVRRDVEDSDNSLEEQLDEAIKSHELKTAALAERITKLEQLSHDQARDLGTAKWIVRGAATSAIGALIYVATKIWSRAEIETESRIRSEYMQQTINRHDAEIERMKTRKDTP
jgi:hypothetical protein